jgi:hypothetical protein
MPPATIAPEQFYTDSCRSVSSSFHNRFCGDLTMAVACKMPVGLASATGSLSLPPIILSGLPGRVAEQLGTGVSALMALRCIAGCPAS